MTAMKLRTLANKFARNAISIREEIDTSRAIVVMRSTDTEYIEAVNLAMDDGNLVSAEIRAGYDEVAEAFRSFRDWAS